MSKFRTSGPGGFGYTRWYNLTILEVNEDDLGTYTCKADNNEGISEKAGFDLCSVLKKDCSFLPG